MDANVIRELQNGLNAAYINGSVAVNLAYKPAFVSNNPEEGKKVISSVEDELSVSYTHLFFIKSSAESNILPLKNFQSFQ